MNAPPPVLAEAGRGEPPTGARLERAIHSFAQSCDSVTALRLEACIHCGMCADACHYYLATGNPRHTPIFKAEPLKQTYKREASPFAPIYRLLGLKHAPTAEQLADWQELVFDNCNLCGRCSLICPMGIDVADLIERTRRGLFEAGLAPAELYTRAERQIGIGKLSVQAKSYREQLEAIARAHGMEPRIDRESAEVLVCLSERDLAHRSAAVVAMLRVLAHLDLDYTFRSECLIAENYGYLAGSDDWQREISRRVIDAAVGCGARQVVIPECGHAYTALRWQAAELDGDRLPFDVLDISEVMAHAWSTGRLRLRSASGASVTFHDPCQLVRKGGVTDAPRVLLAALGIQPMEMANHGGYSFCCGGGGGVQDLQRARPMRLKAIGPKLQEIDATGAEQLVVSCSGCRASFEEAAEHLHWDKSPLSLLELVADHLDEDGRAS